MGLGQKGQTKSYGDVVSLGGPDSILPVQLVTIWAWSPFWGLLGGVSVPLLGTGSAA